MKKLIFLFLIAFAFGEERYTPTLESFNTGQVGPRLEGRIGFPKYQSACRTLENMFVTVQGPVQRRPGTKFIAEVKDSNYPARLIPFEFSTEDAYAIELGEYYARFYRRDLSSGISGQVLTGQGTEDISDVGDNAVAHWKLNENDSTTTVIDSEGSHTGTASSSTQELYYQYGNVNSCFDFDGDQAIDVNDSDELSFDDSGDNPFTIAGWVFVTDTGEQQTIVSKWKTDTAREYRLYLDWERKLCLELFDDTASLSGNLVAQWYLNDDAASTAVDEVTTNHDGTATANTNTLTTTGKISAAFDLDGQYAVEIADDDELTFNTAGQDQPFSVSAWVYLNSGELYGGTIFSKQDISVIFLPNTYDYSGEYCITVYGGGEVEAKLTDASTNGYIRTITTETLSSNNWYHIAFTYSGNESSSGMNIYINGELTTQHKSSSGTYEGMETTAIDAIIGASYYNSG
ncbi:MAG: hypothetical protein PHQ00_02235, partial [Phycisphaerae bacterium]|nr:hypothetical protein [Phycisphaerae bacterium]